MSTNNKKGSGFNYRDSGNGRYISERKAENKPRETWERERRPAPQPQKRK